MRPKVEGISFPCISEDQRLWLERLFEEEEVKGVICMLEGDKALGLDGFPISFYKECWETLKADLMEVVSDFCERRRWGKLFDGFQTS